MAMNVGNYSQFYKGSEQLKQYGNGSAGAKDTLVRYEFSTTDAAGNRVMDQMSREETLQAMKEISSQYGSNVIVSFSGDGIAKLIESEKGGTEHSLTEEELAAKAAKQAAFDEETVQMEGTYIRADESLANPSDDFRRKLKEADPDLFNQMEALSQRIVNHRPGDESNSKAFMTLMKKAGRAISAAEEKAARPLSERAQKLLEKLRRNYGNMDFLVSGQGGDAKSLFAKSTKEFSVIFTAEELEKMASGEKYEQEYMDRIRGAVRMSDEINRKYGFESAFGSNTEKGRIAKIGIAFHEDGSTSFFAELEKSSKQQRERIEAAREKHAQAGKTESKKEPLKRKKTVVEASSLDELVENMNQVDWSRIKEENGSGRRFDFSV